MAGSNDSSRWDEQIRKLKEIKEKKENGQEYRLDDIPMTQREQKNKTVKTNGVKYEKAAENNPYIRKISLDELIDISREMKGEKPLGREKKTPFVSKEMEMKTPEMDKKGM